MNNGTDVSAELNYWPSVKLTFLILLGIAAEAGMLASIPKAASYYVIGLLTLLVVVCLYCISSCLVTAVVSIAALIRHDARLERK